MPMDMKVGDLEPALVLTVSDPVADFRDVTAWRVVGSLNGVVVFNTVLDPGDVAISDATPNVAVLTRAWAAGDTANPGEMKIEARGTWPGGPQTFPAVGTEVVTIHPALA
ncbi:hypothetical protein [Amycolatopsis kentuckyensis]|uniref:hypothetical protein n=1 Tax=Amycolatopsis kentuckyensis TaxID=218823 RepID=UPI000A3C2FCF|nr:hypothetical protein [Amycolatopsis kentuckyensis]